MTSAAAQPEVTGRNGEVLSAVASTGPMMKATSSRAASREKAVWMSSGVCRRAVHRARTREPMEPASPPARAESTTMTTRGIRIVVAAMSPARAAPEASVAGTITRDCPRASTRRARSGAPMATATMLTALTSPAAKYSS